MPPFKRAEKGESEQPATPKKDQAAATEPAQTSNPLSSDENLDTRDKPKADEQAAAIGETGSRNQKPAEERKSWYGGTWPRTPYKASAITQVAKESISASDEAASKTKERARSVTGSLRSVSRKPSSLYMSPGVSTRSLPITGDASKVNVLTPQIGTTSSHDLMDLDDPTDAKDNDSKLDASSKVKSSETPADQSRPIADITETPTGSWRGWIPGYRQSGGPVPQAKPEMAKDKETSELNKLKVADQVDKPIAAIEIQNDIQEADKSTSEVIATSATTEIAKSRPKSWFGFWGGEADGRREAAKQTPAEMAEATETTEPIPVLSDDSQKLEEGEAQKATPSVSAVETELHRSAEVTTTNQGWSFWYRGTPNASNTTLQVDERAANTTQVDVATAKSTEKAENASASAQSLKSLPISRKRERPTSTELPDGTREDKINKQSPDGKTRATATIDILPSSTNDRPSPRRSHPNNLLLPTLKQTLRAAENPGLLSRLAGYFYSTKTPSSKHVNLVSSPSKIRHALAIGVHGYFPAPFIRTVIGQPRGTSVRFATNAAEAISEWGRKHGHQPKVDKIALEGEGKIEERVELLWQLLIKHIDKVREADFILVACHSQGVPVAVQLVAKLISFGCLSGARVGICAMAGINQGPFPEYKSRWIGGSAAELFDFSSPNSKVSTDYEVALNTVLKSGIKIVFVGSIDDQLVSMESATFGNADHPCLFRAVFVNGQVHAPTFVVHLVGFALKLRNLGIPDHGLIRELSNSLAGSFTGDGHSKLYEDPQLYDTAIEFALETTSLTDVPLNMRKGTTNSSQNPYILPFAMRGVLEEEFVRSELHSEMVELLEQFDEWKPSTKPLKDVKFRLEGVRSKI